MDVDRSSEKRGTKYDYVYIFLFLSLFGLFLAQILGYRKFGIKIAKDGIKRSALDVLSRGGVNFKKIREIWKDIPKAPREAEEQIEISSHYSGYLDKQNADILAYRKDEGLKIPDNMNYDKLSGLSNEVKSKFKLIRPKTLGQALRIDGITPAAVYILLSHVKKSSKKAKIA